MQNLKILADRHHSGLTESLILLFEGRLGYELYFQKGMEWYPQFWDLQPFESTAKQYLERELEGVRGITLEDFKNAKFDILLCSIPQHVDKWITLRDKYQPQAKLIFQVGNMWAFDNSFPIKNILASAVIPNLPGFNTVSYHQEFDTNKFSPCGKCWINEYHMDWKPHSGKKIYSFINCLNAVDLYKKDWGLFIELERLMPDWEFKSFGGQCRDGALVGHELIEKMRQATFIFQCKSEGDGYGHVIHQSAAMGKPLITRYSDYQGKLAEPFMWWDMAINVEGRSPEDLAEDIKVAFEQREEMSKRIYNKFKEVVDFDKEEQDIRHFLDNLL